MYDVGVEACIEVVKRWAFSKLLLGGRSLFIFIFLFFHEFNKSLDLLKNIIVFGPNAICLCVRVCVCIFDGVFQIFIT